MICTGHRNSASAMTSARATPSPAATPMARLMLGRSFLPQYWLIRMPNTMEISRNTGTLAAVTAAISSLPSWLTISVSIRPRENVIRFCRAIGPVNRSRYL